MKNSSRPLPRDILARLGPVSQITRFTHGTPVNISLSANTRSQNNTIHATLLLAKSGLSLMKAKRSIEKICDGETVDIPFAMCPID